MLSVNRIRTVTLAALMATAVTACKRPAYTPMAKDSIPARTTVILDSLAEDGKKISENSEYVHLGSDTLELNKDFTTNPTRFFTNASMILRDKFTDKVCKGERDCVYDNVNRIGARDYLDMYIDKTVVIPNSELYTTDSKKVFVPVEYYGRVNPDIINFL